MRVICWMSKSPPAVVQQHPVSLSFVYTVADFGVALNPKPHTLNPTLFFDDQGLTCVGPLGFLTIE